MKGFRRLVADIEDLDAAQAEARAARSRLIATVEAIQARAAPARLLDDALTTVRTRTSELAHSAGDAVRKRPATAAAVVAGIGFLLAAGPLARWTRRLLRRGEETAAPDRQFNP